MTADAAGLTEFYDYTRRLLLDAKNKRDIGLVNRAAIRVQSARFAALSQSRRDDLLELYSAAMMATGMAAP